MGKKGQYSVVYYLAMVIISLFLFAGFLYLSGNLQSEASEEFGIAIMKNLIASLNKNVADVRVFAEMDPGSNVTKEMRMPALIGNEEYYIYGRKNVTVVRLVGGDTTDVEDLYAWPGKQVKGLVYGGKEEIKISYNCTDSGNISIS